MRRLQSLVKWAILSAALLCPLVTFAQSYKFNIPAQSLDAALKQFGLDTGRQVLFSPEVVAERRSNAVVGSYDAIRALEILLARSGLTYEATAFNVLVIKGDPQKSVSPAPRAVQKRAAPQAATEIEEITVTAQKREESIQETPISVTALTSEVLERKGTTNVLTLGEAVPNLRIAENPGNPSGVTISMRGLTQGDPQAALQPAVGLYIDGVYMAKVVGSNYFSLMGLVPLWYGLKRCAVNYPNRAQGSWALKRGRKMSQITQSMGVGIGAALVIGLVMPSASWAQAAKGKKTAGGPRAETEIEEITVTAQKREESIQETPISVTALTSEVLERKGTTNVLTLGEAVPNLRIAENPGNPSGVTISMRGLTQGDPQAALQPAVGLYIDGVYMAKVVGSNFDLEDLERVEVLRGPQGTLYGRNTIGGAVNFITQKPTEERSITVRTEVGNYDTFRSRVTVNVPLIGKNGFYQSDALGTLSLRETAGYKTRDGFYTNDGPNSGSANFENLNRVYTMTALRWQPTKAATLDYSFEYHRYRDTPTMNELTYVYPDAPVNTPAFGSFPNPYYMTPYIHKNRVDGIPTNAIFMYDDMKTLHRQRDDGNHRMNTLTAAWDIGQVGPLGDVTLKSISSYRNFVSQADQELDGTPAHVAEFSEVEDIQHWSEELQWIGTAPRVHYVLGAYYYGEYAMQHESQIFFGGVYNLPYKNTMKTKSYAPYGQITYTPPILGDRLSVTLGMRFTQEQVHLDHHTSSFSVSAGKAFGGIHGAGAPGISPMADISYQWTDDVMTYFRLSRGFRGGGFTPTAPTPDTFLPFKPEKLLAYEMGFKTQWLDKRLRINADGFYSDYTDLQESIFHSSPTVGAYSSQGNVDSAEIWGMEFEATAIPLRGLEATVSYSFLAPKYTKWRDLKFDANGNLMVDANKNPILEDVADKRAFAHTPQNQATVGLTYTAPPTSAGTLSAHIETYWQDKVVYIVNNLTAGAQADEGWAYALVNGRLQFAGIPLQKGRLDLAVFGRNLLDRKYRTYGIDFGPQFGYAVNNYGNPRTFGLQLTYNFTAE